MRTHLPVCAQQPRQRRARPTKPQLETRRFSAVVCSSISDRQRIVAIAAIAPNRTMTRTKNGLHTGHPLALLCISALAACGSGGGDTGGSGGDPGSGGGPGGPGGNGNPLAIVLDFSVANGAAVERTETIRASVPFPETGYPASQLGNLIVSGHQTAWLPLQFWADGTVKVAQAQFTDTLGPGELKSYTVARDEPALTGAFQRNGWVSQMVGNLQLGAEVRDTFQVPYRAVVDVDTGGTVLQTSPLVQVTRHRTYHLASSGGIGRDYLTSTFYVTEFRDMPFVMVDWILGNDYLGADSIPAGNTDPNLRALGVADVRAAHFLCKGASAVMPYRASKEGIGSQESMANGFSGFRVMTDTYLGDAQTRRYRFLLRCEPAGASSTELTRWQNSATAMIDNPIYALGSQQAWAETRAAGLLGGPIAGPGDADSRAVGELGSWEGGNWFGTWGSRSDPMATATTGTPRNHPLSPEMAHAIQGNCHALIQKLEQMAWTQAMRPYHLYGLQVGAEQQICLWSGLPFLAVPGESLGRRTIRDADPYPQYRSLSTGLPVTHGWEGYDHEHWSCDLLFDYWTLSGDEWAREELRQLGESLKGLMRLTYYFTKDVQPARAEGWCMWGFVQIYQATRNASLKDYAMRRVNEIVDAQRRKNHASRAMTFQPNYAGTGYPMNHEFFLPWHHGAVLWGYLAAYKAFGEPVLLAIAEDVPTTIAYSWITNYTSSTFGFVPQGLRYYVPVSHNGTPVAANYWDSLAQGVRFGDSPLGGAHTFLTGGLYQLAAITANNAVRQQAVYYGGWLRGELATMDHWNKWNYCLPDYYAQ